MTNWFFVHQITDTCVQNNNLKPKKEIIKILKKGKQKKMIIIIFRVYISDQRDVPDGQGNFTISLPLSYMYVSMEKNGIKRKKETT